LSWISSRKLLSTPGRAVAEDGVEDGEKLPHTGDESDLGGLPRRFEAAIERLEDGIPSDARKGRHVEHGPYGRTAAPDHAPASESPAVAIERGDAYECGDLLASEGPEFGQHRHERHGR